VRVPSLDLEDFAVDMESESHLASRMDFLSMPLFLLEGGDPLSRSYHRWDYPARSLDQALADEAVPDAPCFTWASEGPQADGRGRDGSTYYYSVQLPTGLYQMALPKEVQDRLDSAGVLSADLDIFFVAQNAVDGQGKATFRTPWRGQGPVPDLPEGMQASQPADVRQGCQFWILKDAHAYPDLFLEGQPEARSQTSLEGWCDLGGAPAVEGIDSKGSKYFWTVCVDRSAGRTRAAATLHWVLGRSDAEEMEGIHGSARTLAALMRRIQERPTFGFSQGLKQLRALHRPIILHSFLLGDDHLVVVGAGFSPVEVSTFTPHSEDWGDGVPETVFVEHSDSLLTVICRTPVGGSLTFEGPFGSTDPIEIHPNVLP
jgi:hypothetical protein